MTSLPIIQVECGECVACCTFVGVPPYENETRYVQVERLVGSREVKMTIDVTYESEFSKQRSDMRETIKSEAASKGYVVGQANGATCVMLDRKNPRQGACTIYDDRPKMCVEFKYASPDCFEARKQAGLTPIDPRGR